MISAKKSRELCSDEEYEVVAKSFPGPVMDVSLDEARHAAAELHKWMAASTSRTKNRLFREAYDRFKTRIGIYEDEDPKKLSRGGSLSHDPRHDTSMKPGPSMQSLSRQMSTAGHQRAAQKRQQARKDSRQP